MKREFVVSRPALDIEYARADNAGCHIKA